MNDPYAYAGTTVLKNKFHLRNQEELDKFERLHTSTRIFEIKEKGMQGNFDFAHLQKIHRYIFQDIYDWAGKSRTVDISKGTMFCPARNIDPFQSDIFSHLKKENFLIGLDNTAFSEKAAYYLGELNMLHPFREGNGRTQREFMRQVALNAGYKLGFNDVTKEKMIEASVAAANMDYRLLTEIIKESIKPIGIEPTLEYQQRIQEIKNADDTPKRCMCSKELFDMYAKKVLQDNQGVWRSALDKQVVIAMKKNGIEDLKINTALGFSPSFIDMSRTQIGTKARALVREVAKEYPELQKNRGMSM